MRNVLFKHLNKISGDIYVETKRKKQIRNHSIFSARYEKAKSIGHAITKLNARGKAQWSFEMLGDSRHYNYIKTDSLNNVIITGTVEDITGIRIKDDTLHFAKKSKTVSSFNEVQPFIISLSETGEINWYKFFPHWQANFIDLNIRNGTSIVCTIAGNPKGNVRSSIDSKIWKEGKRNFNQFKKRIKTFQLSKEGKFEKRLALPSVIALKNRADFYKIYFQTNGNYLLINHNEFEDAEYLDIKAKNKSDISLLNVGTLAYFSKTDSLLWVKNIEGIRFYNVNFIDNKIHFTGRKHGKISGSFDLTQFPSMNDKKNREVSRLIYGIIKLDGTLDFITMSKYTWLATNVNAFAIEQSNNGYNYLLTENLWKKRNKLYPPDDILIGTKRAGIGSQLSLWKDDTIFLFTDKTKKIIGKELKSRITTFQIHKDVAYINYKTQLDYPRSDFKYFFYDLYNQFNPWRGEFFYRMKLRKPKIGEAENPNELDYNSHFIDSLQLISSNNNLEDIKLLKSIIDDTLTIQLKSDIEYTLKVFRLKNDKEVSSLQFSSPDAFYSTDLSYLNDGFYYLKLSSGSKWKVLPFKIEREND